MNKLNLTGRIQKGFTLIELLIVIAVLGVLSTVVLVAIDPVDRIAAANDAKVQRDIATLANALQAYAVTHDGNYPATLSVLQTTGELKSLPTPPTDAGRNCANYGYNATGPRLSCNLLSKKYTVGPPVAPFWVFSGSTGKACAAATAASNC